MSYGSRKRAPPCFRSLNGAEHETQAIQTDISADGFGFFISYVVSRSANTLRLFRQGTAVRQYRQQPHTCRLQTLSKPQLVSAGCLSAVRAPKLVHLLEVGLIITTHDFPAFRDAFEPSAVNWDVDPLPFIQRASNASSQGRVRTVDSPTTSLFDYILFLRLVLSANRPVEHLVTEISWTYLQFSMGKISRRRVSWSESPRRPSFVGTIVGLLRWIGWRRRPWNFFRDRMGASVT